MKPYPEYKTTGLPWLPKIPKHWDCLKIREIFSERNQKVSDKDYAPLSVSKGGIVPQIETVAKTENGDNRKLVRVGDFVINSRSDRKSSSGISRYEGSVSLINIVLKPRISNGLFLHYLLKCHLFVEEFYRNGRGIVADLWTTRLSEMKGISIPLPPLDEQAKIVRYLDVMTAKIDKLIAAKKKQIALLQEKKQAVINQAVTRGLNPEVELKDSGIDWLGKIPKHWARDKVSRLFGFIGSGTTPSVGDQSFNDEKECIPWINSGDLYYADPFIPHISKKLPEAFLAKYSALKKYPENTIVIAMYGASIGNLGISREVACCNQACCCLWGPNSNITLLFSYYALLACKSVWQEKSNGGGQPNISQEIVRQTWLPVPPLVEQIGIVRKLDLFSDGLRTVIQNLEKEIALCADYKNSLISSIVTGAVDVREIEISSAELMWEDAEGMCATRD